jgi:hypothetical protein
MECCVLSDGELVTLVLTPLAMQQRLVIGVDADDEIDTTGLMATGADAKHSVRVPGNAGVITAWRLPRDSLVARCAKCFRRRRGLAA